MTADEILNQLIKDNDTFRTSCDAEFFKSHQDGQSPLITLVTCSDSRVQLQAVSQDPLNRIFVIRNIGNQISTAAGSLDYGIFHLKTPLLLILGHANCGAVQAFLAGYENEPVAIRQELNQLPLDIKETREDLIRGISSNIHFQVDLATNRYLDLVQSGELTVAGAYYDFTDSLGQGLGKLILLNINGEKRL